MALPGKRLKPTIETTHCFTNQQPQLRNSRKHRLRLGTWNVRTLNDQPGKEEGKTALLVKELTKHKVDICGLSEIKREGTGAIVIEQGYRLLYSGSKKGREHGVGFCLSPAAHASMVGYTCISNSIIYAEFRVQPNIHFVVLQVYAPHSARPEEESDAFYAQLTGVIASLKGALRRNLMVLGDLMPRCVQTSGGGVVLALSRLGGKPLLMESVWCTFVSNGTWQLKARSTAINPMICILGTQMSIPGVS
jgi:hypothetical protein